MSYLTTDGVRKAVTHVIEIAAQDKGPAVAIVVVRADHAIVDVCSMDGVRPSEWKIAECAARTAMHEECYTLDLENEGRKPDSCSPSFFTTQAGGVVLRAGKDGAVVGAVGVSGRESHCVKDTLRAQNHELALMCGEAIPNCYPVDDHKEYLAMTCKGAEGRQPIIKGDWEVT